MNTEHWTLNFEYWVELRVLSTELSTEHWALSTPATQVEKQRKKNMKIDEERRKPTKSAEQENGLTAFTLHKNTVKRLSSESWKIMKMMKNHEKSKTKRAEMAQSVSKKKTSQARKRGLCLRNRRKSKKNKKTKKIVFFFIFASSGPAHPTLQTINCRNTLAKARPTARIFAVDCLKGWVGCIPGPHPNLFGLLKLKGQKKKKDN